MTHDTLHVRRAVREDLIKRMNLIFRSRDSANPYRHREIWLWPRTASSANSDLVLEFVIEQDESWNIWLMIPHSSVDGQLDQLRQLARKAL